MKEIPAHCKCGNEEIQILMDWNKVRPSDYAYCFNCGNIPYEDYISTRYICTPREKKRMEREIQKERMRCIKLKCEHWDGECLVNLHDTNVCPKDNDPMWVYLLPILAYPFLLLWRKICGMKN